MNRSKSARLTRQVFRFAPGRPTCAAFNSRVAIAAKTESGFDKPSSSVIVAGVK
jgi:hypothetical protein